LVDLVRLCLGQAHATSSREVAEALRCMAKEYERQAAVLDGSSSSDTGEEPNSPEPRLLNRRG
jgi:hypothetical protein